MWRFSSLSLYGCSWARLRGGASEHHVILHKLLRLKVVLPELSACQSSGLAKKDAYLLTCSSEGPPELKVALASLLSGK